MQRSFRDAAQQGPSPMGLMNAATRLPRSAAIGRTWLQEGPTGHRVRPRLNNQGGDGASAHTQQGQSRGLPTAQSTSRGVATAQVRR